MLEEIKGFWGLRETQSKGMRFSTRYIWHYFTYQETWANGNGLFTVCRANWKDNDLYTKDKRTAKPPREECCSSCHAIYNKEMKNSLITKLVK